MSLEKHLTVHLQSMFVDERDYQMYLCDWSGRVKDQQLKTALNTEIQGINMELDNLKKCLTSLGQPLNDDMVSPTVQAMRTEDMMAMEEMKEATPTDMDMHICMHDISFGHMEIGTYQGMLTMAKALNRQDIVGILEETLQHEEEDLQKMQTLLNDLVGFAGQQQRAA